MDRRPAPRPRPDAETSLLRRRTLTSALSTTLVAAGLSVGPLGTTLASAEPVVAEPPAVAATVTLTLPERSRSDLVRRATVTVADADGGPVPGAPVDVQVRDVDGSWTTLARTTSAEDGTAAADVVVPRAPRAQQWRALVPAADTGSGGDPVATQAPDDTEAPGPDAPTAPEPVASALRDLTLSPWQVTVSRQGGLSVVDGRRLTQSWTVTTPRGTPVPGATVVVRTRSNGSLTRTRLRTDAAGTVVMTTRPRYDSRWVVRVRSGSWHAAGASEPARVDNLPPGPVVRMPSTAPAPRVTLPPQARALKRGPRPQVSRIPRRVWREMRGVTWRPGCPVGRADLRLVRVSYWAYDGYARRGAIVVNAAAASNVASTFADLYRSRLPLRSLYRVDRFGYSARLNGGDDFASMAAGNTSGFNCRRVVNYTALSPHAYGFAIDINPWENPYRSRTGVVPNTYWLNRSHPLVAWRSSSHRMVQLLYRHGWSWPYGLGDLHHFSAPARGRYASSARAAEDAEHEYEHGTAAGHAEGHRDATGWIPGTDVALD